MLFQLPQDLLLVGSGIQSQVVDKRVSSCDFVTVRLLPEELNAAIQLVKNEGGMLELEVVKGKANLNISDNQRGILIGVMNKLFALSDSWYLAEVPVTLTAQDGKQNVISVPYFSRLIMGNHVGTYLIQPYQLPVSYTSLRLSGDHGKLVGHYSFISMEVREILDPPLIRIKTPLTNSENIHITPVGRSDYYLYETWSRLLILMNQCKYLVEQSVQDSR